MKKLNVNKEACIGCGACVAIDEDHFNFGDDGLSEVISQENTDTEDVKNAISSCPVGAISYTDCNCKDGGECDCGDDCECEDCGCENCKK